MDERIGTLSNTLEALLFSEGGALTRTKITKILSCTDEECVQAVAALAARLTGGITLIQTDTEVALAVAPSTTKVIDEVYAGEKAEIGDAGLEVLAILLYSGPSTRATIDYIRGVNSSFSVRALLTRGLIERAHNPGDSREYLYRPTVELLAHLGARSSQELPEYASIRAELEAFESKNKHNEFGSEQSGAARE